MEVNEQTLYDDELLNILPDGVIILDIFLTLSKTHT